MAKKRDNNDFYAIKARREGYPARSVYKLEEIDKKFQIFKKGQRVLDVGAAPGSWSMFACKRVGNGSVVGVDLKYFSLPKSFSNFTGFVGDAFSQEILEKIGGKDSYSTVICDAAPDTTGNRSVDTARSFSLVEEVILLSDSILKAGGSLIVKVFQGGDEKILFDMMKERFSSVKAFKPDACKSVSFETYFIGKGKK